MQAGALLASTLHHSKTFSKGVDMDKKLLFIFIIAGFTCPPTMAKGQKAKGGTNGAGNSAHCSKSLPPADQMYHAHKVLNSVTNMTCKGETLAQLEPEGMDEYCPGYKSKNEEYRLKCWSLIMMGIMHKESGGKVSAKLKEDSSKVATSGDGVSKGVFQMHEDQLKGYVNHCGQNQKANNVQCQASAAALTTNVYNGINCGVMAAIRWVSKEKVVAEGQGGDKGSKGLAKPWAVMRGSGGNKICKENIKKWVLAEANSGFQKFSTAADLDRIHGDRAIASRAYPYSRGKRPAFQDNL